ncbi:hypothetical protein ACH4NF_01900 [Streptomyces sp. NPDC017248]|uniref:hypothetical protein n=1 Tax=unclassified Streptomyces TaxID=2593676 RepID=UPI003791B091
MSHDLTELARVAHALEEAHSLLETERRHLQQQHGPTPYDAIAGSPAQTLHGVTDLARAMSTALEQVVMAAGYCVLGLGDRADRALALARNPVSFPSGADRMARPLGEATVGAMELVRDLGFFDTETTIAIEVALAAPQATYPPTDWSAHQRQKRARSERD